MEGKFARLPYCESKIVILKGHLSFVQHSFKQEIHNRDTSIQANKKVHCMPVEIEETIAIAEHQMGEMS